MTTLSLQSRDRSIGLSIRIQTGQFCTIGSSAMADYSVRASGVAEVHCRIGCRSTGGFIECPDPANSITVNGVERNRSRLLNGDSLLIGSVDVVIEVSPPPVVSKGFDVTLDDVKPATTQISAQFHKVSNSVVSPSHSEPKLFKDSTNISHGSRDETDDEQLSDAVHDSASLSSDSEVSGQPTLDTDDLTPAEPVKYATEVEIISSDSGQLQAADMLSPPLRSNEVLTGGSLFGKYWRWTGIDVRENLDRLVEPNAAMGIYRLVDRQVLPCSREELFKIIEPTQGAIVCIISHLSGAQLTALLQRNDLGVRIGHPQGLTMHLTFLSDQQTADFFDSIDTCVLLQDGDVEMLRYSNRLGPCPQTDS